MIQLSRLRGFLDSDRIEYGLASSAAVGALSLVDPARLSPGRRFLLRAAAAAVTGATFLIPLNKSPVLAFEPAAKAGFTAGMAGLTFGVADLGEAVDGRIQDWLRSRGIRRPRAVMAAAGAAMTFLVFLADRRTRPAVPEEIGDQEPRLVELDPAVRELVEGMLGYTQDYGAPVLRAQLAVAKEEAWDGPEGFSSMVDFAVGQEVPRVVPHNFTFPVRARFTGPSGAPLQAELGIEGGLLRSLLVDVVLDVEEPEGPDGADPLEGLASWPAPGDVTYVIETADAGTQR
ncbi:hypothetical protein [Arthrobacter mobilis]|uniref:Uncharacterized protein n=1 Tax=Arthrobacter mobilis TaxID=2724944 RepID=A0A7X6HCX5_9MICC|nr:hypothetical protein [Arthrobacter mobilis]NKX54691.1 hypothetical protein [Arthrobacter mobilis]